MEFEWDFTKAEENFLKHGISFPEATIALDDPMIVEELDDREQYGEDRVKAYAMGNSFVLTIVYTERGEVIRIISARRATRHEQDYYYRQNAP
jgi:uncharacterized DUF497 family protein